MVGYVGRVTSYKQPDLFVEIASLVAKEVSAARFVMVGGPMAKEKELLVRCEGMVQQLGLADNFMFFGWRSDVPEIMSEMAVLCLPSTREPFPRVALEAMLCRCSVVASTTGGCPEILNDGEHGSMVDPMACDAAHQFAEAIVAELSDFGQRSYAKRREAARDYALRVHGDPTRARRLVTICDELWRRD